MTHYTNFRSVKLLLTKAELYRISNEVYQYDMLKRKQRSFTNYLSRRSLVSLSQGVDTDRKNDPRYKFAMSLMKENPELYSQVLKQGIFYTHARMNSSVPLRIVTHESILTIHSRWEYWRVVGQCCSYCR